MVCWFISHSWVDYSLTVIKKPSLRTGRRSDVFRSLVLLHIRVWLLCPDLHKGKTQQGKTTNTNKKTTQKKLIPRKTTIENNLYHQKRLHYEKTIQKIAPIKTSPKKNLHQEKNYTKKTTPRLGSNRHNTLSLMKNMYVCKLSVRPSIRWISVFCQKSYNA